jgi:hypothetical protein
MDSLFKLYNLSIQLDDISPLLFELFFGKLVEYSYSEI